MLRLRLPIVLLVACAALGTAVVAEAGKKKSKQVKFVGVHPIPKAHGGGLCHIEATHVHVYTPSDVKVQYRVHDDHHYFVGDPVAYGWEGPRHSYYGHHPVHVHHAVGGSERVEYCYLDGPHYHGYAPPPGASFEVKAGVNWYVGDLPAAYVDARATYQPINVHYEPIVYERPAVVVEAAPPAWVGFTVAAPVVVHGHKHKRGRGHAHGHVEVGVVAPSLHVEVGVPALVVDTHVHGGVIVHDHHHHKHYKHKKHKKHKRWKRKSSSRRHYR
jgi:hypothetical protein